MYTRTNYCPDTLVNKWIKDAISASVIDLCSVNHDWKISKDLYERKFSLAGYNKETIKVKVSRSWISVKTTDNKYNFDLPIYENMDVKSLKAVALDGILTLTINKIPEEEVIVE